MTPRELAEEAREALRRRPERSADEVFQRLIDAGIIALDADGHVKVLTAKLFGEDEGEHASLAKKKGKKRRKPKQE